MGKEPFGSGRSSTFDTIASDEQIAECRWGYQCSVCLLAGDLLCCEVRPPGPHTQPQPLWLPSLLVGWACGALGGSGHRLT